MSSECELCGKPDSSIKAVVEGSLINVCKSCAQFGSIVEIKKPVIGKISEKPAGKRTIVIEEEFEAIRPNYAEIIRTARESAGLEQKEVAKLISEKESIYQKIESGNFKPSIELAKKLERFFKIKIIEAYNEPEKKRQIDIGDSSITIGDLLNMKK